MKIFFLIFGALSIAQPALAQDPGQIECYMTLSPADIGTIPARLDASERNSARKGQSGGFDKKRTALRELQHLAAKENHYRAFFARKPKEKASAPCTPLGTGRGPWMEIQDKAKTLETPARCWCAGSAGNQSRIQQQGAGSEGLLDQKDKKSLLDQPDGENGMLDQKK